MVNGMLELHHVRCKVLSRSKIFKAVKIYLKIPIYRFMGQLFRTQYCPIVIAPNKEISQGKIYKCIYLFDELKKSRNLTLAQVFWFALMYLIQVHDYYLVSNIHTIFKQQLFSTKIFLCTLSINSFIQVLSFSHFFLLSIS